MLTLTDCLDLKIRKISISQDKLPPSAAKEIQCLAVLNLPGNGDYQTLRREEENGKRRRTISVLLNCSGLPWKAY